MKEIKLTNGGVTLVSNNKYNKVKDYHWFLTSHGYVSAHIRLGFRKYKHIYLHRLITNCPKGKSVDHINHDTKDNRDENLRTCDNLYNLLNQKKRINSKSIYKGVGKQKFGKSWTVEIWLKNKKFYIGSFPNEIHAAMAYDIWAKELHGKFAFLNFPNTLFYNS